jgi:HD-like signal output (HDOD) protein
MDIMKTPSDQIQFAQRVRMGLPVLTPRADRILRACENPAIDLDTLAETLSQSPAIAARLLGLANSSFYCLGSPASSLPKALLILGLVTVRGIAAALVIGDRFSSARCPAFHALRFWEAAVLTAQVAQLLAQRAPPGLELPKEAVYMAGLLHNIGLLALASLQPGDLNEILMAHAGEPDVSLGRRLRERLGFDHRQVAGWIAEAWNLPSSLRQVLSHCHEPGYAGEYRSLVLLTGLSASLARAVIAGGGQAAVPASALTDAATLGFAANFVEDALKQASVSFGALRATAETFAKGSNRWEKT